MTAHLTPASLKRWRATPSAFIEDCLCDPETGAPYKLLPAERAFLEHAFKTNGDGRLLYSEQLYSCPKKRGKTAFAALHVLVTTLLFGGHYPEATCAANDYDQAQGRVFEAIKRVIECSPMLRAEAKITANKIIFSGIGATITAIPSDYAGAAGGNPTISCFDELWAYVSERSRRLWDELVPPPTRKIACRLTIAPWQTPEWITQMRGQLRPNAFLRMIENRFVTTESVFVDMAWWDACVDAAARSSAIVRLTANRIASSGYATRVPALINS